MNRKFLKILKIVTIPVILLVVVYVSAMRLAVNRQAERLNKAYWEKMEPADRENKAEMHRVPGYNELLKKQGLLRGMVKMAADDSIGLFLNLPDSTLRLMVKGVGVRDISIQEISKSSFFSKIDVEVLYELLSGPFQITGFKGTIAKEPLNIVQAPKDSSDVIPMIQPNTTHVEPVFFILNTDKRVRFYFYQTEGGWKDNWAAFVFDLKDRYERAKTEIPALSVFTLPEYIPTIRIGIRKKDAKVLYRAIPWQGQVVLTL